jgi:alkylhydroperoxidase family enzyme
MFRMMMRPLLARTERQLGGSVDWMRHVLDASPRAFRRFLAFLWLAGYRRAAPAGAWHVAGLVAVLHEDCGPCVQIAINVARKDGVPREVLQAVLDGRLDDLPAPLADAARFARSVVARDGGEQAPRERLRALWGDAAVVELAFAVASARVFPTAKRGLGFARSCALEPPRA